MGSKPHDHVDQGYQEVYVLVDGSATAIVDDEDVSMEAGDAVRIDPESERQIRTFCILSVASISCRLSGGSPRVLLFVTKSQRSRSLPPLSLRA